MFKGTGNKILYIGKAANLKRRVSSYFSRAHDSRIERLVSLARKVDHRKTDTALEALILEASLIKKYAPPFNVREKDDKSFLYVEIADEEFPRILLVRGKKSSVQSRNGAGYGPFTSASSIRAALTAIRRIFPFNTHLPEKIGVYKKPCFDHQIGLCPGTCVGEISKREYARTVQNIKLFFEGKKERLIRLLEKEMKSASRDLEFEHAAKLRRNIFALRHIQDTAFISNERQETGRGKGFRIEGYDISNISGTYAVGAMVVFEGSEPDPSGYRKFRIRTVGESDDVGMMQEMLQRRFTRHSDDWTLPDLVLVDGGKGQVNVAKKVLDECGLRIPVLGIAKGPERKKNDIVGEVPKEVDISTLVRVRDEAHRFAVGYHRKVRTSGMFGK